MHVVLTEGLSPTTPGHRNHQKRPLCPRAHGVRWSSKLSAVALDADQWRLNALRLVGFLAPFNLVVQRENDLLRQPLVAVTLTIGVVVMASALGADRSLFSANRWFLRLWSAWVLLLWIAVAASPGRMESAGAAARISVAAVMMAAAVLVLPDVRHATPVLRALVAGAAIAVVLGATVQLVGHDFSETDRFFGSITELGPYDRLTRPWAHANVAAMAIGASIAGVVSVRNRYLRFAVATMLVVGAVLTYSRGAFLAIIVGGLVWSLLRSRSTDWTRAAKVTIAALAGIAIIAALATPGWLSRASGDDQLAWWQVEFDVPSSVQLNAAAGYTTIDVINTSDVTWSRDGDEPVLVSARWVVPNTDIVRSEHRWMLPADLAPGERLTAGLTVDPLVPNGSYDIHWDLLIEDRAYFRQFAGLPTVISQGLVVDSARSDSSPAVGSLVPPRAFPGRTAIWSAAVDAFVDSPVFGAGPGRLRHTMPEDASAGHAHHLLLEPLATWGLAATAPFVLLVGGALVLATRRALVDRSTLSAAVVVGLVIVIAHGMVDWALIHVSVAIPAGLLCGLGWNSWGDTTETPNG